jgi:biopolymer transport protein ExbB
MTRPITPIPLRKDLAMRQPSLAFAALSLVLAAGAARAQGIEPPPASNPYGLAALWASGDVVARGTLLILVVMSVATCYVIVGKAIQQTTMNLRAHRTERRFWSAPRLADGMEALDDGAAFGLLARAGRAASEHHDPASGEIDRATWISMALERGVATVSARLQEGLALLATVASTAPFVGLFGTVWGVYHALTAIGISGQASLDKVAGPVGEALIMTAIGLATAVPAVLGYNLLTRRNKSTMDRVRGYAADLHAGLLFGRRIGTAWPIGRTNLTAR